MFAAAVLMLALACQDDVEALIKKLGSDEFVERESSQRALERLGMPILDRLIAEAENVEELDAKLRLKTLIEKIPRLSKLAMVYGPTKRVSISARGQKLGEVFRQMESDLGEQFLSERLDLAMPVTLELDRATLWEALDALARASGTHYFYRKDHVVFEAGAAARLPVLYYEQFRISVVEVKRVDYRAPGVKDQVAIVVPEVRYQRNLSPAGDKNNNIFSDVVLTTPTGTDATGSMPTWARSAFALRRPFGMQEFYRVDPKVPSFSVSGKATINFAQEDREILIPLTGEKKELVTADGAFRVAGLEITEEATTLKLELDLAEAKDLNERFKSAWLVDAKSKRHLGFSGPATRVDKLYKRDIRFPGGLKDLQTFSFRWMSGLHAIEIPFTLRDIRIP